MRLLQTTLQALAGILILVVPLVIVYWVLNILDIEPLSFIQSFLGAFLEPPMGIIRSFTGEKITHFKGFEIDLVPIFFCVVLFFISLALTIVAKILQAVKKSYTFVEAKTKAHFVQKQHEAESKEEETRVFENTIGYAVVRYKTQTTSSAYLVSSGLSDKDIKNMFMEQFNRYMYLDAQLFKESTDDNLLLVFEDVPSSLTYALTLQDSMIGLNKQLDKAGTKLLVTCGIYCATPSEAKSQAFLVANKVCNLAGPGEVAISREVKCIFEKDRSDHNMNFTSKGMYDLGQEIEIFTAQKLF